LQAFRLAGICAFLISAALIWFSIRIAWADWLSKNRTRASILAALRIFPENSLYYRFWAEIEPRDAVFALQQASRVNPRNPAIRIELGMAAEKAGNLALAESSLIAAVSLERTFAPRRLLAEFYFRRGDAAKFWLAVRDALNHSFGDTTTLFEDCWALAPDSQVILSRAVPARPDVLMHFLEFLVARGQLIAAFPVADRVMALNVAESGPVLLHYCDQLIFQNFEDRAVTVWNWLCRKKLTPYSVLEPGKGLSLTNGSFTVPAISQGFDWRFSPPDGTYLEQGKPGLTLTFSGKQPEQCELLSQVIPLEPERAYRLTTAYNTRDIDRDSGISWRLLVFEGPDLPIGNLQGGVETSQARFVTPPGAHLGRLVLKYQRMKGTVRIEGAVQIRSVELSYAQ
jgi:tetratricopeptide (TPR) repeat protein